MFGHIYTHETFTAIKIPNLPITPNSFFMYLYKPFLSTSPHLIFKQHGCASCPCGVSFYLLEFYRNDIIQHMLLFVCLLQLLSLSVIILRFTHIQVFHCRLVFQELDVPLVYPLAADGHLSGFQVLTIINKAL